uniref:Ureidoglycolate lyase n=1 Tax=Caenorhabditis tropicalis TaxID=1561998 RepID=A0A1I7TR71_9PELO
MPAHFHVPTDFTKDPIQFVALEDTGAVLTHSRKGHVGIGEDKKEVQLVDFVGGKDVGVLENSFAMQWQNIGNTTQVHFTGTGGSLAGAEGNPGVFLIDGQTFKINILQKRTDGSFYLEANEDFLMVVAKSMPNGSPDVESIQASQFPASGVKLPIGYWHSVPFPIPGAGKLNFVELVAKTDKNAVINIPEHTGTPLRIPINPVCDQDD